MNPKTTQKNKKRSEIKLNMISSLRFAPDLAHVLGPLDAIVPVGAGSGAVPANCVSSSTLPSTATRRGRAPICNGKRSHITTSPSLPTSIEPGSETSAKAKRSIRNIRETKKKDSQTNQTKQTKRNETK
jgi:hypothetical protein